MFSDPRQLHLLDYRTNYQDTVVGQKKNTIRTVYNTYYLGKDPTSKRFGKVEVWKTQVTVVTIDQLPGSDTCYQRLNEKFEVQKKMVDSLISTLRLDTLSGH